MLRLIQSSYIIFLVIRSLRSHRNHYSSNIIRNVDHDSTGDEKCNENARMPFCKSSSSKPVVSLRQWSSLLKSSRDTTHWCKQFYWRHEFTAVTINLVNFCGKVANDISSWLFNYWGQKTHVSISKLCPDSNHRLSPVWHQALIQNNAGLVEWK